MNARPRFEFIACGNRERRLPIRRKAPLPRRSHGRNGRNGALFRLPGTGSIGGRREHGQRPQGDLQARAILALGTIHIGAVLIEGALGAHPRMVAFGGGLNGFRALVMPPVTIIDVKDVGIPEEEMVLPQNFRGDDHFMVR